MPSSPLAKAAADYVAEGYRIIPCHPGGKAAMLTDWHTRALETKEQVDEFFSQYPDANIAFCPDDAGIVVIDIDPGADPTALVLPVTLSVKTPRGGSHLYYRGSGRSTVNLLGPHIDTRGQKGYALLPPSVTKDGAYEWKDKCATVALPVEIESRLAERHVAAAALTDERDLPANVGRARDRLRTLASRSIIAHAVECGGGGGDDLAYRISAELVRDLGLSRDAAISLLLEEWYPYCIPNDRPEFIIEKVENVIKYGQNSQGAHAVTNIAFPLIADASPSNNRFRFKTPAEMQDQPDPTWIIPQIIPDNSLVLLTAAKGSFKSFLALDMALGIASGKSTLGLEPASGLTFYGAHEGLVSLQKMHRGAWCRYHNVDPRSDIGFYMGEGPRLGLPADFAQFGEAIAAKAACRPVKLIVIDTYSAAMMGADENDPGDANNFIFQCRALVKGFPGSSLLTLAHFGKDRTRGTRGTNALEAGFDTLLTGHREPDTNHVSMQVVNHRAAPEPKSPIYLEGRPVAGSLVFLPVDRAAIILAKEAADPLAPANVARCLISHSFTNAANATTTVILAGLLQPQQEGEEIERYAARIKGIVRALQRLARSTLKPLRFGDGADMKWCHDTVAPFPSQNGTP